MARKKQPVDVEVLRKVIEVKDLERTLRDDNPFYQDPESLRNLGGEELTDGENETFARKYVAFVDDYTDEVISGRLQAIYDENAEVLNGTPEERYVQDLIKSVGKVRLRQGEDTYDIKLGDLDLSVRSHDCLKNDEIKYVGQLVQKSEREMLRTPNIGRKSLRELKELLGRYGLRFGMDINYLTPEERSKGGPK